MKIAYLIASYGNSTGRLTANMFPPSPSTYMSLHMDKLRECDSELLDSIYILKAKAPFIDEGFYDYSTLGLPKVKEIDYPNMAQSYGQWVRFIVEHLDFDYYILIEDDYCFNNAKSISLLLSEHKKRLPDGGFLCSRILNNPRHAGISNGVVDGKTINDISSRVALLDFVLTNPVKEYNNQPVYQINFALLFGAGLADISDTYSVPYWLNNFIEYGQVGKPTIFVPSQFTDNSNSKMLSKIVKFNG